MIIEFSDEPQTTTPKVFLNSSGWEAWGGKPAAALTADELSELWDFCRREGSRQGWNDAVANRVRENSSPFHPTLLDGVPLAKWGDAYREGVEEHRFTMR